MHLNLDKRYIKARETELVIDLSPSTFQSDENLTSEELNGGNMNITDEKSNINQIVIVIANIGIKCSFSRWIIQLIK